MRFLDCVCGERLRVILALLMGVLVLLGASDNSARMDRLGHKMICMCGCNQVLLECNHYGCPSLTPMHEELVAAIDKGYSDSSILQAFTDKYGPTVLAAPTSHGFDVIAWIMPYLVLTLGIGGVVLVITLWHRRVAAHPAIAASNLSAADLSRLRDQARRETDL